MMNPNPRILGIASVVVVGAVAACSVLLSGPSVSHAAPEPSWHRLDRSTLFLHDLTSGPATLAAAMEVAPDDSITGNLTTLHELRYMHGPDGLVAARSREAAQTGASSDGVVLFNPSTGPVMAYFEIEGGLKEVLLLPGEGVAIGELDWRIAELTQQGCRCICFGEDPESGETLQKSVFMACHSVMPQHETGTPCDCSSVSDQNCWLPKPVHPEFDGLTRNCSSGLIPASKSRGN